MEAASLNEQVEESQNVNLEKQIENGIPVRRSKVGFRDRKIIEYENRIRHYSTP